MNASATSPDPVLLASGLTKSFDSTRALAGVDVTLKRSESLAIMGASGSGKTTLLHALSGIIVPDAGTVTFRPSAGAAIDVSAGSETARSTLRREHFGFVFQQGLLIPELTAIENVALAAMITGVSRTEATQRAAGWLASLGLTGMEDRRIGELSGGQAQRVAIARAQVTWADVVFADEPTGALDSTTSGEVMDALLRSTTGQGRSLVVVTHDPQVAARCSRVLSMRDGAILEEARA
ncbi:ABC transporter ATP-binding protein [Microbacterium pseudoresistens]|uniref:Putative ABC transport system ATP-binding protein n=1 Tax=Microbacterium pseudoresistens TaxID=640634 RepID=A0A7Y9JNL2_9MICO|nr:ABC transporter ATP-binding protein [Microbacterium pseudoresistens]NYD55236.1 putative ABC transport system ATP-binding protein [Microbacterium pseudoresistens]